jgi:hypothetical protein
MSKANNPGRAGNTKEETSVLEFDSNRLSDDHDPINFQGVKGADRAKNRNPVNAELH